MRSGNWHYVVEELLLRDRERLEDVHGEDTLEKSENIITATVLEYFLIQLRKVCKKIKICQSVAGISPKQTEKGSRT